MAPRQRFLPELPPTFAPPPDWARATVRGAGVGDALFYAGAALAAIHSIARHDHPLTGLWRQRLALTSAAASVRLQGRAEDEAVLRDHLCLTRPGDDPGPAAKLLQAWRALATGTLRGPSSSRTADWLLVLGELLSAVINASARAAIETAVATAAGRRNPIEAAASAAATSLKLQPDCRPLALWLADAVLARGLGWSRPVPLLAAHLKRDDLRLAVGPHADPTAWRETCAHAYARAAAAAFDLYADLARRAGRLLAVAPKLRGKDADAAVLQLLSEDALTAQPGRMTSDRSSRRLFERLVEFGVVRELSGRPTFRLYGI